MEAQLEGRKRQKKLSRARAREPKRAASAGMTSLQVEIDAQATRTLLEQSEGTRDRTGAFVAEIKTG